MFVQTKWNVLIFKPSLLSLSQFLVYFIYFTILTVIYSVGAAVVIIRHYRNQPRGGGETNEPAAPVELHPVAAGSEAETLSNGKSAKA